MRCRPGGHASVSPFGIPPLGADNFLGGASGRIYCPVQTKLVTLKLPQRCAGLGAVQGAVDAFDSFVLRRASVR